MKTINRLLQTILVLPFTLIGGIVVALVVAPIKLTMAVIDDIWEVKGNATSRTNDYN